MLCCHGGTFVRLGNHFILIAWTDHNKHTAYICGCTSEVNKKFWVVYFSQTELATPQCYAPHPQKASYDTVPEILWITLPVE